jgi:hypothetical protein
MAVSRSEKRNRKLDPKVERLLKLILEARRATRNSPKGKLAKGALS